MISILTVLLVLALMFAITAFVPKLPLYFGRRDGFARIKLGPNVTDIRGTIKEVVYSIWKTGVHYIRSKAGVVSNPQSLPQGLVRMYMTLGSKRWFDTLTGQQRDNWNEFASGLEPQEGDAGGILNIIPQNRGIMSGFNAYCLCYTMVLMATITLPGTFDDSPLGATPPSAPGFASVTWNTPDVDLVWSDPTVVISDSEIRIWMRSRENIAHKQLVKCEVLTILGKSIANFRGAGGASIRFLDAPGHYLWQLDCVQPNGLKSNPSRTLECVVT